MRRNSSDCRHPAGRLFAQVFPAFVVFLLLIPGGWSQARPQELVPQEKSASSVQSRRPSQRSDDAVELSSELVSLDVAVVDQENHILTGLTMDDFIVFEDNVQQKVSFFSEEEAPSSLGLVIDTSKSMATKLNSVIAAALRLVRESHPDDEYFIIEFKAQAELIQDFTRRVEDVEDALNDLVAHGQTALLDAVFLSVQHMRKNARYRRKAIVAISDGEERDSYYTAKQVLEALRETDVQVFAVGFTAGMDADRYNIFRGTGKRKIGRREKRARSLLDELAEVSGGRAFYPEDLSELEPIAQAIARELRTQYIIGYYPTNPERDGSWRPVRVEVKPDKNDKRRIARARAGYYATARQDSRQSKQDGSQNRR